MGRFELKLLFVCALVLLMSAAPVALGDWDVGDGHKMHYPQLPDLSSNGLDVLAGPLSVDTTGQNVYEKFLADDFKCTRSGPITDIHIWGSYNGDERLTDFWGFPPQFSLVIYENKPADTDIPYSRPGAVLWDAYLQPTAERVYATAQEGFYDPNPDEIIGSDTQVWQFNFEIDPADAFVQEAGKTYWLGVHHTFDLNGDGLVNALDLLAIVQLWPNGPFGWKTSGEEQFEDDAVWTDVLTWMGNPHVVPEGEIWNELRYPPGHELQGLSMDLAFVITGAEEVVKHKNLKWSQPPIEWDPMVDPPRYCGWDEESYLSRVSTAVYQNWDANQLGWYLAPGAMGFLPIMGDDMTLAGTARKLDYYDFAVNSPVGTAPYTVTSELYTDVGGLPGAPIPGTLCNHNVAFDGYGWLTCSPGSGAILPNKVWMVLSFSDDNAGWQIAEQAELGSTDYRWALDIDGTGWNLYWWTDGTHGGYEADISCETEQGTMAADDFRCLGPMPVTSIHWWGSHVGWEEPDIMPPDLPIAWRIGFWSNVSATQRCDFLYGAATGQPFGNAPSSLYKIDPFTAVATLIGPIGFNGVTGLSFAPDGTLYGTCRDPAMGDAFLITIDTMTGAGTAVGRIDPAGNQWAVPDISFRSNGVLYGYGDSPDQLITINTATGQGTAVGPTGYNGGGNGLDFAPNGTLYATPYDNQSLVIINPATGAGSDVAGTVGNVPERINALEFCESTGVLYGSWNDSWFSGFWYLVTLDLTTGLPTVIGQTVDGLDAITFNTFSHPEKLLWQIEVPEDRVDVKEVGMDEYPDFSYDVCYQYYVDLEPDEIFWQNHYKTMDDIYWLSIAAVYEPDVWPDYPWGWKTRPWSWMDDGVRFWVDEELEPGLVLDPGRNMIEPIEEPIFGESFDLAFELDTDPNYIKWEQPFTGIRDWPHYEDELSMGFVQPVQVDKWCQYPDLSPNGVDVDATVDLSPDAIWLPQILADDFNCTVTEPITDIHIWGSWYHDERPFQDAGAVDFTLSIYSDKPAGDAGGWSEPNELLWSQDFASGDFDVWTWAGGLEEGYYVPCEPYYEAFADTICYQYDFYIDPCDAFIQKGEPCSPVVYWLVVEARPLYDPGLPEPARFGWKTSTDHWNDDAVWSKDFGASWNELRYPTDHPFAGQSIDLAFEITTEGEEFFLDRLVADDWPCEHNEPVTDAVWWGSYLGYRYAACVGPQPMPPVKPDYFLLNIWTDVPADSADPTSYSHPNDIIWEYKAYDYDEVLVGYDKDPRSTPGPPREPVFRYSVRLPEEDWFCQEEPNDVYWFSVVAVYGENVPSHNWGWTNHKHMYNDDAVEGYFDPGAGWFWYELYDQTEQSEDMSFILFTEPECFPATDPAYANWVTVGRPGCWCCKYQPMGDTNGDGAVNILDMVLVFKPSYAKVWPDPAYNPCADFNHDKAVNIIDMVLHFKPNYGQVLGPGYDCPYVGPYQPPCP